MNKDRGIVATGTYLNIHFMQHYSQILQMSLWKETGTEELRFSQLYGLWVPLTIESLTSLGGSNCYYQNTLPFSCAHTGYSCAEDQGSPAAFQNWHASERDTLSLDCHILTTSLPPAGP